MADNLTDSPRPPISSPASQNLASQQDQQPDPNAAARARRQRQNLTAARMRQQQDSSGMVIDETGERIRDKFYKFLSEYEDEDGSLYYQQELQAMEEAESTTMNINWEHIINNYSDLPI